MTVIQRKKSRYPACAVYARTTGSSREKRHPCELLLTECILNGINPIPVHRTLDAIIYFQMREIYGRCTSIRMHICVQCALARNIQSKCAPNFGTLNANTYIPLRKFRRSNRLPRVSVRPIVCAPANKCICESHSLSCACIILNRWKKEK